MATTIKPPTHCPQCRRLLHWMAPQPPEIYLGVCLPCGVAYFGTASGQAGSRPRLLSAAEQERNEEANRWD